MVLYQALMLYLAFEVLNNKKVLKSLIYIMMGYIRVHKKNLKISFEVFFILLMLIFVLVSYEKFIFDST